MKLILEKIVNWFKSLNLHVHLRKINLTTILGLLSYIHVLAILTYFLSGKKPFVRFHAKQGLILLAFITVGIFAFYFAIIPWIVVLFYLGCIVYGFGNVVLGRERKLPIIGGLAERI